MAKIAVITDPDTGIGFKLTGIDVYTAPSYQEAAGHIERFLKTKEYEMAMPSIQSWREGE